MSLIVTIDAVALTSGFTNGFGQIWLDNVICSGTENRLINCRASPVGVHNCASNEDAGVRCQGTAITCTEGDIRLAGGTHQGRVDICYNNVWGTVCSSAWNNVNAEVACRQLGLPFFGKCMYS